MRTVTLYLAAGTATLFIRQGIDVIKAVDKKGIQRKYTHKMKTVTLKIYQFSELSKAAQATAIDEHRDINVDDDYWSDCVYSDAAEVGIKITFFDLGCRNDITGELREFIEVVCQNIIASHGEKCETHKTAKEFLTRYKVMAVTNALLGTDEAQENFESEMDELTEEFLKEILKHYWTMLDNDYEYQQSEEAIRNTIECNDYEFYKDGTRYVVARKKTA